MEILQKASVQTEKHATLKGCSLGTQEEDHGPSLPMHENRSHSPVPSCVSMKSDQSMDLPLRFSADVPAGQSPMHKNRSHSPVPSCVSMKSDQSMDLPLRFSADVPAGQRSHSPIPSCVSMKSDHSMDLPLRFSADVPAGQSPMHENRSHSPVPSCVSMKSDQSMDLPLRFSADCGSVIRPTKAKGDGQDVTDINNGLTTGPSYQPVMDMKQTHKLHLLKKYQCLMEGITHQGNPTLLRKIYTELYITEGERGVVNDEHEVRQIERASWRKAAHDRPIKCSDIFKSLSSQDKPTRTVLTKGVAGIGKTVSVQKFILDWAEGKANQDVDFIFPLPFRELNLMKEKRLSLVDVMQHFYSETTDPSAFTTLAHRVMFIFDGLDECRLPLDFHLNLKCCDVREPAMVDVLLTNLIMGNLLPSALLWITTRPAAAGQIPYECIDRVTEIRGFNDPQKEEYLRKRIADKNLASRTITHLKSSRSLYIMCHIPVFCWISATVVERTSDGSGSVEMPRTLTQMYTRFLIIQTSINDKYMPRKDTDEEMIFKLGKLAYQQLEKGNVIFYEEDLTECDIDVTEASVYSGVCTQIFREESVLYHRKVFSFVHLSIQEFLAALYVFLRFSNGERHMPEHQQTSQLSALFRAATLHDLHKTAVDLALQSEKGNMDLFLRFLLGLSLESNQSLLTHLLPHTSSQSQSPERTVQLVKHMIRDQNESDRRINLFYCLNELNQHAVVEHTGRSSGTLSVVMLLPGEWKTGKFEFETSEELLKEFNLQKHIKTPEKDQTELLSPEDVFQKLMPSSVFTSSTSAKLYDCPLTEKSCFNLSSVLTSHSSSLTQLQLEMTGLSQSSLTLSSSAGCHPDCKPWRLRIKDYNVTEEIYSVLTSHTSTLSAAHLGKEQGELLCSALCHQHCRVQELLLYNCWLTEKTSSYLASVLTSHTSSLTRLDVGYMNLLGTVMILGAAALCPPLQDSVMELICSALCHPNCKLEKLQLYECPLTEQIWSYLASLLTSHSSSLTQLELSNRMLAGGQREGTGLLCSALGHPNCKLEKLVLYNCWLTQKSCSDLASVLTSHLSSLAQLQLSDNNLKESEVELLCSALCHQNCKLKKLLLCKCPLTEKSCSYLASVLTSHSSSLTQLELSKNNLQESGGKLLCSALRLPHCKLEKLVLHDCPLTEKSCSYLASVLTSHSSSLTQLQLKDNNLQESGAELLCSALCHPSCKLEKLVLHDCPLTEKSCSYLASVLTSHSSRLTQLELDASIGEDSAAEKLSVLQEDPHYQVRMSISENHGNRSKRRLWLTCKVLEDSALDSEAAEARRTYWPSFF